MIYNIERLKEEIFTTKEKLIKHQLYSNINSMTQLQVFMQNHVFAVWDFMSLLKTLQINLTCTSIPWLPVGSATTRYLINEIVIGEESDVDENGTRMSHFEMYLEAMKQAEASVSKIEHFTSLIKSGESVNNSMIRANVSEGVAQFIANTFNTIYSGKIHVQAAVFTFGREDLIPGMFMTFVNSLKNSKGATLTKFKYYLERHIEIDGDHHSQLGYQMTSELCGNDSIKWMEATNAINDALQSRLILWDYINALITKIN
jgi:pyrroloquinoline quinone (PQQ) biosynthesis protein C